MSVDLFDPVKTMAKITDSVILGFSTGKDSIVTLDLASRYFRNIYCYFLYIAPGLEFQERILRKYERRYKIEIERLPHPDVSNFFKYGTYRPADRGVRTVEFTDLHAYLRVKSGYRWIIGGERINDSLTRRAYLKQSGSIDLKSFRMYPIISWSKQTVLEYIRRKKLVLPNDLNVIGKSFCSLNGRELLYVKEHYPEDFERIKSFYPLCEVSVEHEKIKRKNNRKEKN